MRFLSLMFAMCLAGCASMNDALTPTVSVDIDNFDGRVIVTQPPVSSSSSLSEGWHTLGFQWQSAAPKKVYLEVGKSGIVNIEGVEFNVDGEFIRDIPTASSLTNYGDWSTRRFVIPISQFKKLASAQDVKMKVMTIDSYSVSSFGVSVSGAVVNTKFAPFMTEVEKAAK
ncbi:hypothetical protein RJ45_22750 [Photobacterium gaetbulicola]|uniref:Lipoprotein n=2 Tax=Photobacterium gaetbulicola TaxID=1295392 RepID=A0A0B9FZ49_9GAMM|nr:hypothetical protein RJ45_22750 [Photobacterium gaetbulicola]